jgi:hypothetical protein
MLFCPLKGNFGIYDFLSKTSVQTRTDILEVFALKEAFTYCIVKIIIFYIDTSSKQIATIK